VKPEATCVPKQFHEACLRTHSDCPLCDAELMTELKFQPGLGYLVVLECSNPECLYKRIL
jgi:hypothetical protein